MANSTLIKHSWEVITQAGFQIFLYRNPGPKVVSPDNSETDLENLDGELMGKMAHVLVEVGFLMECPSVRGYVDQLNRLGYDARLAHVEEDAVTIEPQDRRTDRNSEPSSFKVKYEELSIER